MPPESLLDARLTEMYHYGYEDMPDVLELVRAFISPNEDKHPLFHLRTLDRIEPYFGNDLVISDAHRDLINAIPAARMSSRRTLGLNVPVYGPRRRIGMFNFAVNPREDELSYARRIQGFCQVIHQRYCEIWTNEIPESQRPIALTRRESDVMKLLVQGMNNGDIAKKTGISRHTVDSYIRRVFIKLGVNDRVSAALKTIELDLLSSSN